MRTRANAALVLAAIVVAGCASVPKRNPVPETLVDRAEIPGMPLIRDWGDAPLRVQQKMERMSDAELRREFPAIFGRPHTYLALSGGGSKGAFGAGILKGWSERGDRPEFTVVTGISTGALIAPFAFLGSDYDEILELAYKNTSTKDVVEPRKKMNWLHADAINRADPFQQLLARHVDAAMIEAIAAEHRRGRQLWIGTTNVEAQRPVAWNIGEIAASGAPGAAELIRGILAASCSIPGYFPPVLFDVEADGGRYDEMHVDGGITSQVFLFPGGVDWTEILARLEVPGTPDVYVIRNSSLRPHWRKVDNTTVPIALHSADSLIRTQGIGDLYRIHSLAQRDGMSFNLAYIPDEFDAASTEALDPAFMRELFELGYSMSRDGYPWLDAPPDYAAAAAR